jgi:hypothetical protein
MNDMGRDERVQVSVSRRIAQVIRDDVEDGRSWIPAMRQTLERLAALVEHVPQIIARPPRVPARNSVSGTLYPIEAVEGSTH